MSAGRTIRALLLATALTGGIAVASGCSPERAVGGEAPGAMIFDRPEPAGRPRVALSQRLSSLGRRLMDRARQSQQPSPLLWPELHELPTLHGTD